MWVVYLQMHPRAAEKCTMRSEKEYIKNNFKFIILPARGCIC